MQRAHLIFFCCFENFVRNSKVAPPNIGILKFEICGNPDNIVEQKEFWANLSEDTVTHGGSSAHVTYAELYSKKIQ